MTYYNGLKDFLIENKNMFDSHIAIKTMLDNNNDCIIRFAKPDTKEQIITFVYIDGYLHVQGDYGCASFSWYNPRNTIEKLAEFAGNEGYFLSKMLSSGKSVAPSSMMKEWDADICIDMVLEHFKENEIEVGNNFDNWRKHTESFSDWAVFLNKNGADFFDDDDYYEYAYDFGLATNTKCFIWLYGLIKATDFLKNKKCESCRFIDTAPTDEPCANCRYLHIEE